MAKYKCPFCGSFVHTSGAIPNPNEFLVLTAKQWDEMPDTITPTTLYGQAVPMYKCVSCPALAIFWSGYESAPSWYDRLNGHQQL